MTEAYDPIQATELLDNWGAWMRCAGAAWLGRETAKQTERVLIDWHNEGEDGRLATFILLRVFAYRSPPREVAIAYREKFARALDPDGVDELIDWAVYGYWLRRAGVHNVATA